MEKFIRSQVTYTIIARGEFCDSDLWEQTPFCSYFPMCQMWELRWGQTAWDMGHSGGWEWLKVNVQRLSWDPEFRESTGNVPRSWEDFHVLRLVVCSFWADGLRWFSAWQWEQDMNLGFFLTQQIPRGIILDIVPDHIVQLILGHLLPLISGETTPLVSKIIYQK